MVIRSLLLETLLVCFLASKGTLASDSDTKDCQNHCGLDAESPIAWTWMPTSMRDRAPMSTVVIATVVEVVNTVSNTTRTTTITNALPSNVKPLLTNSEGTKTGEAVYTRSGSTLTTVITFPGQFYKWPDAYSWHGTLQVPGVTPGASDCITAERNVPNPRATTQLLSNPQPTATESLAAALVRLDHYGWHYILRADTGRGGEYWRMNKDLFPDQVAIQSCTPSPGAAPPVGADWVSWMVETSTQFETDASAVPSAAAPPSAPSSTPPPGPSLSSAPPAPAPSSVPPEAASVSPSPPQPGPGGSGDPARAADQPAPSGPLGGGLSAKPSSAVGGGAEEAAPPPPPNSTSDAKGKHTTSPPPAVATSGSTARKPLGVLPVAVAALAISLGVA